MSNRFMSILSKPPPGLARNNGSLELSKIKINFFEKQLSG
jgi:hypothetical protein